MKYFIRQIGDKDCGITCLKMLFAILKEDKNLLYFKQDEIDKNYSLLDLINIAKNEGVILRSYTLRMREELYDEIRIPSIITVNRNGFVHTVLINKKRNNKLLIYDPSCGVYWLNKKEVENTWNGQILEVISYDKKEIKYSKESKTTIIPYVFSIVFQIFSVISIVLSITFMNNENNFYLTLGLFVSYIIFELLYKKVLILGMQKYDFSTYNAIYNKAEISIKNFDAISKHKISKFTIIPEFVSYAIISLLLLVLLSINSLYNIISCGVILLIAITFKLIDFNKGNKKKYNLEKEEDNLLKHPKESTKDDYLKLNKMTYSYISYLDFKKYVNLFAIISLTLLYTYFSKNLSINFMIFYFFMYSTFSENISKLFMIDEKIDEYKKNKALYLYYCNKAKVV